jgi:hypothetical protein
MVVQLLSLVTPASFEITADVEELLLAHRDAGEWYERASLAAVVSESRPCCDVLESPRWCGLFASLATDPRAGIAIHCRSLPSPITLARFATGLLPIRSVSL